MLLLIASELFGKNHRVVKTIREQISNNERTTNRRWGSQISVKLDTNQAINKLFEFLLYWSLGVNIERSPVLRLVIPNRNLVRGYLNVRWGWSLKISLLQNIYSFFWPQFSILWAAGTHVQVCVLVSEGKLCHSSRKNTTKVNI